ncbi:MAG: aminotransferase class V-fold PLP-dependent enzyme, partial [Proteobacteria bacterium]|nr:aminotransferase class V-fold PLP-dependent enzyme [Pseudomonadota bacterium]
MDKPLIYLDNAATSFPKPDNVIKAVASTLRDVGGNPGRSGHRMSMNANRLVFDAREKVASLFGVTDSSRLIFTSGATESLNLAI